MALVSGRNGWLQTVHCIQDLKGKEAIGMQLYSIYMSRNCHSDNTHSAYMQTNLLHAIGIDFGGSPGT